MIWDPTIPAGIGQFAVIQSVAPSLGIDVRPISVHGDIERAIAGFARVPNGGLVVSASASVATESRRELITTLAARHKLPLVANTKFFVTGGGLMSYGANFIEQFRRAAGYVDRILKGDKPADFAGASTDQVRTGNQPENRQVSRPHSAAIANRARRRRDRIRQVSRMSAFGT